MKRLIIYGLSACLCVMMHSCLFSEENIFEASSAQRAMASVKECNKVLQGAANGWLLEYYPGDGPAFGGYNLLAKFDGEKVEMAADVATEHFPAGEISVSLYKVLSNQSTELSFDSYNEVIHSFCEPSGFNAPGYAGDYEFVFKSVSKEKIVLTGKKHGNTLVMTPMPLDVDWETFLKEIVRIQEETPYATYKLKVGEGEEKDLFRVNRTLTMEITDEKGKKTTENHPFIYTQEGIKLLEPLDCDGVKMTRFRWDGTERTFLCSDEGVQAAIAFHCPEKYKNYLGIYLVIYNAAMAVANIAQKVEGVSYTFKAYSGELAKFPIELTYNMKNECMDILFQYVGNNNGQKVYVCPWSVASGYLTWTAGSGLSGYISEEKPLTISFRDNGVWGEATGFVIFGFYGAPSNATVGGSIAQVANLSMRKIG